MTNKKIYLLPNFDSIYECLLTKEDSNTYNCNCIWGERIALEEFKMQNTNVIRIWKTFSLFDYWFKEYNCENSIANLDYIIYEDYIKIDYLFVNNNKKYYSKNSISNEEEEKIIYIIINFIKNLSVKEKKTKIIMDVHKNLNMYKKYYYYSGFELTNRTSKHNPYWREIEINLDKN